MDVTTFIGSLRRLDTERIMATAAELGEQASSVAGELAWWRATVCIERRLRRQRAGRRAAMAASQAASAVVQAAHLAGLELPDSRVTAVARAAADVARGLVAQAAETEDLLRGCRHLVAA